MSVCVEGHVIKINQSVSGRGGNDLALSELDPSSACQFWIKLQLSEPDLKHSNQNLRLKS